MASRFGWSKRHADRAHFLFDVPVAGLTTIETMIETGTTALAMDAGRTLLLDKDEMLKRANEANLAIIGYQLWTSRNHE